MNETRSHATGKTLKVICERVGECAGRYACRRVDHETSRLVYHHKSLIFVNNLDWNIFRCERFRSRRDQLDFNFIMFTQLVGRLRGFTVDEYVFVLDQTLQTSATPAFDL